MQRGGRKKLNAADSDHRSLLKIQGLATISSWSVRMSAARGLFGPEHELEHDRSLYADQQCLADRERER